MKRNWHKYIIYDKRERRGILSLITLITFGTILFYSLPYLIQPKLEAPLSLSDLLIEIEIPIQEQEQIVEEHWPKPKKEKVVQSKRKPYKSKTYKTKEQKSYPRLAPFDFDPNTISTGNLKKMQLAPYLITRIENYRKKGGRFYQKEDVKKIYGMTDSIYSILDPFIKIPTEKRNYEPKAKKVAIKILDINSATASELKTLRGIGDVLSKRIVKFRDGLGGFHSVDQIKETYGLADSTFLEIQKYLTVKAPIKRINLNTVELDSLKKHQYIRYKLAKIIINYRHQHGDFTSLEELKNIKILAPDEYNKISPYLSVN